jgi:hypothetical protein
MTAILRRFPGVAHWFLGALVTVALGLLPESTAVAFNLFATHEVTVQFATADGKPMANAEVTVFAPGDLKTPVETGHTDSAGKFVFGTDRDGLWSAQARTKGEVARVMIRVGGPDQQQQRGWISPVVVIGGLLALLALAIWYRVLRLRNQRRER